MKSLNLALVTLACATAPLFADTVAPAATAATVTRPVAVKVVYPTNLGPNFNNETVLIKFRLDRDGKPHDVTAASLMPDQLENRLVIAVSQWRFTPCQDQNGMAVERDVVLPIELSDHVQAGTQRLAMAR